MRSYRALAAEIAAGLDLDRPDLVTIVEGELIRAARRRRPELVELLRRVERAYRDGLAAGKTDVSGP
jgi:hypothetical protein